MNQPLLWCIASVASAVTWPAAIHAQATIPSKPPAVAKAKAEAQRTFATPEQAAAALADAIRSNDLPHIHSVLGPVSVNLIHSGDSVQDAAGSRRVLLRHCTAVE